MGRQILIVLLGVVLTYLMMAMGGYLVYHIHLSSGWSEPQLGALVRYLVGPLVAAIVGGVVGALAKRRAGALAALSLLPLAIVIPLFKRLAPLRETILILLSCFYLLLGAGAAQFVSQVRSWRKE